MAEKMTRRTLSLIHICGNEGQRLHGGSARLQIHMDDNGIAGLVQQLLLDQIHMGDLGHLPVSYTHLDVYKRQE